MGCFEWMNKKVKNMDGIDIALTKIGVAAFILMVAKLWSGILALPWYWYAIIFVLAAIRPWAKIFGK
ncbi:hypothetical protein COY26_03465 [Candidatus Woesearchaeota archaeon CG_4_10_14_0_2_um_filter_33_10]|nr:MAG: hypothetical protein AUJ83_04335 [Candidatus Woesearchaeota archaeon CG1_02_33_12]PIZ52874.1 MAG: hypothetical protein COY26_03465 [Candidatus Woesearchaeota archaeon CG_4_10_14_0_2_um_filter_33_10]